MKMKKNYHNRDNQIKRKKKKKKNRKTEDWTLARAGFGQKFNTPVTDCHITTHELLPVADLTGEAIVSRYPGAWYHERCSSSLS